MAMVPTLKVGYSAPGVPFRARFASPDCINRSRVATTAPIISRPATLPHNAPCLRIERQFQHTHEHVAAHHQSNGWNHRRMPFKG